MSTQAAAHKVFPILRAGPYKRGGKDAEISEADLDQAVVNFEADTAAGVAIAMDYDHAFAEGRGSRASGWIRSLVRSGADLIAEVDWTPAAEAAIEDGEYRGCSAEFSRDHATEDGTRRGFSIVGAALTNRPFLRDLAVAFSAERTAEAAEHLAEIEALIETGDFNIEACAHGVATVKLMAERNLAYPEAAAAAWKETR